VPAILATRTIPDTKRRILTMLLIPFMSCSARLPILVLLVGTFFPQNPVLIIFGLYGVTIILAILTAFLLDRIFFKTELDLTPVEVLPIQKPKMNKVLRLTWDAGYEYLKKIGTVVLIAMMAIWFLSHFPRSAELQTPRSAEFVTPPPPRSAEFATPPQNQSNGDIDCFRENTYLARFGHFIEPALRPLGFDWKMSVCLTTGLAAKEFIVGTMVILYHTGEKEMQVGEDLKNANIFTTPVLLAFLVFAMLYMPCVATIFTIKRESGSWKWALFSVVYSIALAWIVAFIVFHLSSLLF